MGSFLASPARRTTSPAFPWHRLRLFGPARKALCTRPEALGPRHTHTPRPRCFALSAGTSKDARVSPHFKPGASNETRFPKPEAVSEEPRGSRAASGHPGAAAGPGGAALERRVPKEGGGGQASPPSPRSAPRCLFSGAPQDTPPEALSRRGGKGVSINRTGGLQKARRGGGEGASAASENGRRNGRVGRVENSARRTAAPEAGRTAAGKKEHPFSGRPKAPSPASSSSSSSAELLPFPGLAQVGQRPAETLRLPGLSAEKRSRPRGCV